MSRYATLLILHLDMHQALFVEHWAGSAWYIDFPPKTQAENEEVSVTE